MTRKRVEGTEPHCRSAQVWHALSRNHTVLPAARVFVYAWNEPYLLLPSKLKPYLPTTEEWKAELAKAPQVQVNSFPRTAT